MAYCITFTTVAVRNGPGSASQNIILPVFTTTTTPYSCSVVSMTGTEYQTIFNNVTTANTNATTATNTANSVNGIATNAQTLATQAKTIADTAIAQTNALANITQGLNTFNQVFNIPNSTMLGQAWAVGFILPMTIGLISFAVAKIVNFWD